MSGPCCEPQAVEALVAEIAPGHRATAVLKVAACFDRPLASGEAAIYDATVHRLARTASTAVRADLAGRLAHVRSGPVQTVLSLAHDEDASVAFPLLRHSPLIPEPILVVLAWSRGQDHLVALAGRKNLAQRVSDMVVVRGSWPVLRTLAANDTASLSAEALQRLVRVFRGDGHMTVALSKRSDVPPALRRELIGQFKELVTARRSSLRGEDSDIDLELDDTGPLSAAALSESEEWVAALCEDHVPTDHDLMRCLRRDEPARVAALIARRAKSTIDAVAEALRDRAMDRVVLLLRSADLGWPAAEHVLRWHFGPEAWPSIAAQRAAYLQLSPSSAKRALRLLRFRARTQVIDGGAQRRAADGSRIRGSVRPS